MFTYYKINILIFELYYYCINNAVVLIIESIFSDKCIAFNRITQLLYSEMM